MKFDQCKAGIGIGIHLDRVQCSLFEGHEGFHKADQLCYLIEDMTDRRMKVFSFKKLDWIEIMWDNRSEDDDHGLMGNLSAEDVGGRYY
jgi:hypothetical protein